MYVYCFYLVKISNSPKQLPNCLKITETSIVLIVFNGVDVKAYKQLSFLSDYLHESDTSNVLPMTK